MKKLIRRLSEKLAFFSRVSCRLRPFLRWWQFDSFGVRFYVEKNVRVKNYGQLYIGDNVGILRNCFLVVRGSLSIGSGTSIGENTIIAAMCDVRIGENCMLAPYVYVLDVDHRFDDPNIPINSQGYKTAPVSIEDDVWIGGYCMITKGVTIGKGAVVAGNSVVNKDVEPYSIVAGSPARKIGSRLAKRDEDAK